MMLLQEEAQGAEDDGKKETEAGPEDGPAGWQAGLWWGDGGLQSLQDPQQAGMCLSALL